MGLGVDSDSWKWTESLFGGVEGPFGCLSFLGVTRAGEMHQLQLSVKPTELTSRQFTIPRWCGAK